VTLERFQVPTYPAKSKRIEDRLDYFELLEAKAKPWGRHGYECLVCGRKISASSIRNGPLDVSAHPRGLTGNARGAMTNHLKGHMRKGEI